MMREAGAGYAEEPAVTIGSAGASAWGFDRIGRGRHVSVSVSSDGSGSITIYRASGTPQVRELATISLGPGDFAVIREAIDAHVKVRAVPKPNRVTRVRPATRER